MRKTSIRKTIAVTFIAAAVLSMAACGNMNAGQGDSTEAVANMDGSTETEVTTAAPDASQSSAETKESSATDKSVTESQKETDQGIDDQEAKRLAEEKAAAEKAAAEKAAKAEAERKAAEEAAAKAEAEKKAAEAAKAEAERKAAEEAANRQNQQNQNQTGSQNNSQNGSQSNSTADVTGSTTGNADTPASTPAPTQPPAHQHEWTPVYETRTVTVVVQEEWFETEYIDIPIVERHQVCNSCGQDVGDHDGAANHLLNSPTCGSCSGQDVVVGYDHVDAGSVIRHPAVTEERTEQVLVGYTCGCGATK